MSARENREKIKLNINNAELIEISLQGTWITSAKNSNEGVFICILSKKAEILLNQLWQETQNPAFELF